MMANPLCKQEFEQFKVSVATKVDGNLNNFKESREQIKKIHKVKVELEGKLMIK